MSAHYVECGSVPPQRHLLSILLALIIQQGCFFLFFLFSGAVNLHQYGKVSDDPEACIFLSLGAALHAIPPLAPLAPPPPAPARGSASGGQGTSDGTTAAR